jgi:hypothetical protein
VPERKRILLSFQWAKDWLCQGEPICTNNKIIKNILTPYDQPLDETDEAIEIIDVSEYKLQRIPSKQWRECIKKIYEVDPLCCPNCGGEMKIISFITDQQVIRQILKHLGL